MPFFRAEKVAKNAQIASLKGPELDISAKKAFSYGRTANMNKIESSWKL